MRNTSEDLIVALFALLGVILFVLIISVIFSTAVMLLWNWLMPSIFGLPEVSYLQALGLFILSNILFKSSNIRYKGED